MSKELGLKYLDYVEYTNFNKDELQEKLPGAIFVENKETDTQGYIFIEGNAALVVFRGTEKKLKDWYTDIQFAHKVYPYGNTESKIKVHEGFITAYKSVRDQIIGVIRSNISKIKHVTVIGHSLGGALATLAAVDIQYGFEWIYVQCVTYGSPRVGNAAFCASFNKRINISYRFYNRTDIVPTVPFEWMGGYKHVAQPYPLGKRDWLAGTKIMILKLFKSDRLAADLTNHSLTMYKDNLINC